MKKIWLSVAALALLTSFAAAQTIPSITSLLQDASFGYNEQNRIAVESIDTSSILLRSPIIKYYNGDSIMFYRLTYSPILIEDLVTTNDPAILEQIKSKEVVLTQGSDRVMLSLGTDDGLSPGTTYYAIVTPIDIYDDIGTSSEQICFNLAQEKYETGDKCLSFGKSAETVHGGEVTPEHSAASTADLALANITHTVAGNTITLRWTEINGVDNMDLFVFDIKEETRTRLGEVRISAERYDYTMKWDGEHMFNFKPLNGAREFRYSLNAMRSDDKEPEKPVITPPDTGPAESVLAMLAISGLLYLGYRRYKLKAER